MTERSHSSRPSHFSALPWTILNWRYDLDCLLVCNSFIRECAFLVLIFQIPLLLHVTHDGMLFWFGLPLTSSTYRLPILVVSFDKKENRFLLLYISAIGRSEKKKKKDLSYEAEVVILGSLQKWRMNYRFHMAATREARVVFQLKVNIWRVRLCTRVLHVAGGCHSFCHVLICTATCLQCTNTLQLININEMSFFFFFFLLKLNTPSVKREYGSVLCIHNELCSNGKNKSRACCVQGQPFVAQHSDGWRLVIPSHHHRPRADLRHCLQRHDKGRKAGAL